MLDDVAAGAGLSEWRAQALAWSLAHGGDLLPAFTLLELYWLGAYHEDGSGGLDGWGAATLGLNGCLCLQLPGPSPWESLAGYSTEVLATSGADVQLRFAETLAALKLHALLAPALAGLVTQDLIDHAQLGYGDDWEQFGRAVLDIPPARMSDYVAALAVNGPLIEIK
jgi:hypothetical protein